MRVIYLWTKVLFTSNTTSTLGLPACQERVDDRDISLQDVYEAIGARSQGLISDERGVRLAPEGDD